MEQSKAGQRIGVLPEIVRTHLTGRIEASDLELPLLPEVTWQIVEACGSSDADADRITKILLRDQGLAGNVLRIANSPISGAQVQIVSLHQAVSRLGMRQIAEIALAVSVKGKLFATGSRRRLLGRLWTHSLAAGLCAKEIARARRASVETAYLTGLLHDMGKPVLLLALQDLERHIDRTFDAAVVDLALDEFHASVGGMLASEWGLPTEMAQAILCHHDLDAASSTGIYEAAATIRLADDLAHLICKDGQVQNEHEVRASPCLERLNLYPDDLDRILDVSGRILETMEAMG